MLSFVFYIHDNLRFFLKCIPYFRTEGVYFLKIYLFLRGMFLFVFWIINFGVPQIFHIIKSVPDFKKIKKH